LRPSSCSSCLRHLTKKKRDILHLVAVSNHVSILKRKKKKEREGLVEIWRIIQFLPQKHNSWWTISKSPQNQLNLYIQSIGGEIASYVKFGLILILFAWGFNSRFNSTAETLLLVNPYANHLGINWNFILCLLVVRSHCMSNWAYFDLVRLRF
jgi:hypothetical protein